MRKMLYLMLFTLFLVIANDVNAEEIYYTNANNVSFTKEQYDYFTAMFQEGYQDILTPEMFNQYEKEVMHPDLVEIKTYVEYLPPATRASGITTPAKSLKIAVSKMTECFTGVTLTWTVDPTIKSYDVMGAYLKNLTLTSTPFTTVTSSAGSFTANDIKKLSNGFGTSIKLPDGLNIVINQSYNTTKGGTVYAAYEHAMSNVSFSNSQNFTIGLGGQGNVFDFADSVWGKYDQMDGVSATC